jgi:hypothetical protein
MILPSSFNSRGKRGFRARMISAHIPRFPRFPRLIPELAVTLMAVCTSACATAGRNDDPRTVAEAEIAFARDAQHRTVNEAFLTAFAADGIIFRPTPVNAHQSLQQRPIPAEALLLWTPTITETAAARDYAVSTGPSERGTRGTGTRAGTGYFLSVWRNSGGKWHVVIDAGIDAPIPATVEQASSTLMVRSLRPSPSRSDDNNQMRTDVMAQERKLIQDYVDGFREFAANDVRVYRGNQALTATIGAALNLVRADADVAWTPQAAFVSKSGDLAYVYGVANKDRDAGYMRIWRNQDGNWKVAYDLR